MMLHKFPTSGASYGFNSPPSPEEKVDVEREA